ncbi:MAG: ABC transporter permease [Chloroflexi bacterium]|nr:ABC transporter permease [Chloroflexota bacterium]
MSAMRGFLHGARPVRLAEPFPASAASGGVLRGLPFPLRSVVRRWRTLVGMILGVGVALGIGMTIMAVSSASVNLLAGDFARSGADLYVHAEGGTLMPILPGDSPGKLQSARGKLSQIRSMPGVRSAFGTMTWSVERERADRRRRIGEPTELVTVVGVDGDPSLMTDTLLLQSGRWIRRADEVVVGLTLAREKGLSLGDTIRLNEGDFRVVGVGRLRSSGWGSDGLAYMEYRALRQRAEFGDAMNVIVVDSSQPADTRARVERMESVAVSSPDDLVRQAEKLLESSRVMQGIIVGLTLTIAGLFVSNMLGRSVTARRTELATMRAIGVPRTSILLLIAGEALAVTALATVVAIGFSLSLGWLFDRYLAPQYGIETMYVAGPTLFLGVGGLALGIGLLAGLGPARRATLVDPVEVLREA